MTGPSAWDRLEDESAKAYAAFQAYRDQPVMQRSLRRLAIRLGRSLQLLARWSGRHRWVERVAAWDTEQDRLLRVRLADEREAVARRVGALGLMLALQGESKLGRYIDRIDAGGSPVVLLPGQRYIDQLSVADAIRLVEAGARLLLAAGSPPAQPSLQPTQLSGTARESWARMPLSEDPTLPPEARRALEQLQVLLDPGSDDRSARGLG